MQSHGTKRYIPQKLRPPQNLVAPKRDTENLTHFIHSLTCLPNTWEVLGQSDRSDKLGRWEYHCILVTITFNNVRLLNDCLWLKLPPHGRRMRERKMVISRVCPEHNMKTFGLFGRKTSTGYCEAMLSYKVLRHCKICILNFMFYLFLILRDFAPEKCFKMIKGCLSSSLPDVYRDC